MLISSRPALVRIASLLVFFLIPVAGAFAATAGTKTDSSASQQQADADDPYRSINIRVYDVNTTFDHLLIKPIGQLYQYVTPKPVSRGVTNFFSNLGEPRVIFNDLLQAKGRQAVSDFARFGVNSIIGVGGLFDVAGPWGLPKHDEDFGKTLAVWGWKKSNYVVLPVLGSSNVRDSIGVAVDFVTYPLFWYPDAATRNWLYFLQLANHRASLLKAEAILDQAAGASERYDFMREAYIQHRRAVVYNGSPPLELPYLQDNDSSPPAKKSNN